MKRTETCLIASSLLVGWALSCATSESLEGKLSDTPQ
jgi:hypothetical protein